MDVIEDIYKNSIQPSERSMSNDIKYRNAKSKTNNYYNLLCEKLSQEEMGILNKLMLNYDVKMERKNVHCFTAGFKKGLEVAVKSLK